MPTEREAVRKFIRSGHPVAEWLKRGVYSGRIGSSDDIVDEDEEVMVLAGDQHSGILGAKQARCGCGAVVWLCPSTLEMMAKRGDRPTTIICLRCALEVTKKIQEAKDERV